MKTQKKVIEELKTKYDLTDWDCQILAEIMRERPTIYTTLNHVSHSGMFRLISCYYIRDREPLCIDHLVSLISGYHQDASRKGLRVTGCGMDMGFAVVYDFSHCLHRQGYRLRKREVFMNEKSYRKDGGYALRQTWM